MSLTFPAICFHQEYALLLRCWEDLTVTTSRALRHGKLENLLLVDSTGTAVKVRGARELEGVGAFGGYNIFLNRKVKVELLFEGEPFQMSVAELKARLLRSFDEWEGWASADNFEETREAVESAASVGEVFARLFSG